MRKKIFDLIYKCSLCFVVNMSSYIAQRPGEGFYYGQMWDLQMGILGLFYKVEGFGLYVMGWARLASWKGRVVWMKILFNFIERSTSTKVSTQLLTCKAYLI